MRSFLARWIIVSTQMAIAIGLVGCANARRGNMVSDSAAPTTMPAGTQPAADSIARLTLDQIKPKVSLPAAKATTQESPAPLDAIVLYAEAREAQIAKMPYKAITSIENAIRLDPDSFELQYALGKAYLAVGYADQAIAAYLRAAEIDPKNLEVQIDLGRAYQVRNDMPHAIERFRLAMLTDDYGSDESLAAIVDYRLAVSLQQQGYDRAALECYTRLLGRLEHSGSELRYAGEIAFLMSRPELLHEEIGKLHESLGEYDAALKEYQWVAQNTPTQFSLQARVVKMLIKAGHRKEAVIASTELLQRFHASPDSIKLLRESYQNNGSGQNAIADALRKLYRERPNDRSLLFALADTLSSAGQVDQARDLLEKGIESSHGDVEVVERLYKIYADREQTTDAARVVIRATAAHPNTTTELQPLLLDLMRLSRKNSLRLAALQKIDVPANAQAAKQYWIWKIGSVNRPVAARAALDQSARATPPFAPAVIAQLETYFTRIDWDDAARNAAIDQLGASMVEKGRPDLTAHIKALTALRLNRLDEAAQYFAKAVDLTPPADIAPDLILANALSLLRQGNVAKFEQILWKLVSDRPRFEAGFQVLYAFFKQNNASQQAANLLNTWLIADPQSTSARLQQISDYVEQRRVDEAVVLMRKLFDEYPDEPDVVRSIISLLGATNQRKELLDLLEGERNRHPNNRVAVEALVELYSGENRMSDATRVIDSARAAVSSDPELLYYVAHLYQRIDQNQIAEEVLQDVLKIDPANPQAGNDLGYNWADAGKNIDQAETLIRMAINAEPDNPAYLDSLGWVLYKRSKFPEALKFLEQATAPAATADAVVLDHLGDTLYRMSRIDEAKNTWKQALARLAAQEIDSKSLPLQLQSKLRQADAGQPVSVAPVVEIKEK